MSFKFQLTTKQCDTTITLVIQLATKT